MKMIQPYLQAHGLHLLVAVLICTGLAFGMIDPSSAFVGGILLETTPIDMKTLHEAMEKAFEAMKGQNAELKTRILDLEQAGARRPTGGFGGGNGGGEIMEALAASDQFKAVQRGELKSARIALPPGALQTKSIFSSITGGTIGAPDRDGAIVAPSARRMTIRGLLPSVPTTSGSTEFVRELVFTNNAGPQGGTTSPDTATEGETKPASDISFELVTSPIITIAHTFTVSRQALDDSEALRQHIETRGLYGLAIKEEDNLLNGTGLHGTLSGLVSNAATFTGGATNQTAADTLRKAIAQTAVAEGVATGVVLNPLDASALDMLKDTTGRYLSVITYTNGIPFVWRVAIIETNSMPQGQFLVGDFALAATIRDRQQAFMTIGFEHSDYMARNLALVLLEQRIGLEVHRPNAMVYGSLDYAG